MARTAIRAAVLPASAPVSTAGAAIGLSALALIVGLLLLNVGATVGLLGWTVAATCALPLAMLTYSSVVARRATAAPIAEHAYLAGEHARLVEQTTHLRLVVLDETTAMGTGAAAPGQVLASAETALLRGVADALRAAAV